MSLDDMNESNDLFWALAKYTENVQESVKKLDEINKKIYPELIEVGEKTWKNLKGMRDRLAHAFWKIDPQILWPTVTEDFCDLQDLLSAIDVIDGLFADDEDPFALGFDIQRFRELPESTPESIFQAGHSLIALWFRHNGKVEVYRIGRQGNRMLTHSNV